MKKELADFETNLPEGLTIVDGEIVEDEKVFFVSFVRNDDYGLEQTHVTLDFTNEEDYLSDIQTLIAGLKVEYKNLFNLADSARPKIEDFKSTEFKEAFNKVSKNQLFFSLVLAKLVENKVVTEEDKKVLDNAIYDGIESSHFLMYGEHAIGLHYRYDGYYSFFAFGQMYTSHYEKYKSSVGSRYGCECLFTKVEL